MEAHSAIERRFASHFGKVVDSYHETLMVKTYIEIALCNPRHRNPPRFGSTPYPRNEERGKRLGKGRDTYGRF